MVRAGLMEKIMSKTNDTTINTVAKTALGSSAALDDAKLDAVAGGLNYARAFVAGDPPGELAGAGKIKFNQF